MHGSRFEFILGIADHGAPVTESQYTVATFPHLQVPFAMDSTRLGIFLHSADELITSHVESIGQICPIVKGPEEGEIR